MNSSVFPIIGEIWSKLTSSAKTYLNVLTVLVDFVFLGLIEGFCGISELRHAFDGDLSTDARDCSMMWRALRSRERDASEAFSSLRVGFDPSRF